MPVFGPCKRRSSIQSQGANAALDLNHPDSRCSLATEAAGRRTWSSLGPIRRWRRGRERLSGSCAGPGTPADCAVTGDGLVLTADVTMQAGLVARQAALRTSDLPLGIGNAPSSDRRRGHGTLLAPMTGADELHHPRAEVAGTPSEVLFDVLLRLRSGSRASDVKNDSVLGFSPS
jgi:hypothetical protein